MDMEDAHMSWKELHASRMVSPALALPTQNNCPTYLRLAGVDNLSSTRARQLSADRARHMPVVLVLQVGLELVEQVNEGSLGHPKGSNPLFIIPVMLYQEVPPVLAGMALISTKSLNRTKEEDYQISSQSQPRSFHSTPTTETLLRWCWCQNRVEKSASLPILNDRCLGFSA
ncbi:hypothetical protein Y1Q_0012706 [Alligator mississippiensis]|uniref:Uncharacterized protein n=1 Tax=Alligator mississippiensis TaxID=8496 RepID=A0A151M8M7_ALLMI|nr:hypothetical protein Y1Q_0012706 [Alligator mississippiensis]